MTNFQKNFNKLKKLRAMFMSDVYREITKKKKKKKTGIDFGEICKELWCKF